MSYNVLVVDDSAVMRSILVRTLRLAGFPLGLVVEAGNGADGLHALRSQRIDVALLDINMPEMPGDELLAEIRRDPRTVNLPVVVVSTERSERRVAAMAALGASFISKPFTPAQIRACVLGVMGVVDA
jgi:two-component system chemotaxis response regulator CheY